MTDSKIVARIKQLLRLSRSSDINEASNAAAHAQRLMARHQLDIATLGDVDDEGTATTVVTALGDEAIYSGARVPFWIERLVIGVASANNCETLLQKRGAKRSLGLVGTPLAISCVRYLFGYLQREIVRLASLHGAVHARTRGLNRPSTQWRNDFKVGAAVEIARRMRESNDDVFRHANANALMRMDTLRRAAKAWVDDHVPGAAPKPRVAKVDKDAYLAGKNASNGIVLRAALALPEGA